MENSLEKYFIYDKNNPLLFNSGLFLILFSLFLVFYLFLKDKKTLRTTYIIIFSLYFFYKTSGDFVIILFGSITLNFIFALLIDISDDKTLKRVSFLFGLVINILVLFYFKYFNFLIDNLNFLFDFKFAKFEMFLTIGISFFTFQQISYLTDVYRKTIQPTENFLDYTFYVSFFPYIISGPIVRAGDLLPQIQKNIDITKEDINKGYFLIVRGLIKKAILSYYITQYSDLIFDTPQNFSGFENLIAIYSYSLQIYLDFSGYSDLAIGISRILGFKIKDNFNEPYKSENIIEFWKRWHISLSTWLRDYLFLPITYFYLRHSKNNKISILNSYVFATIITMTIAGIWHGAANKFAIWGILHGLALVVNRLFLYFVKRKIRNAIIPKYFGIFITFNFISLLWITFRSPDINAIFNMLNSIFLNFDLAYLMPFYIARPLLSIVIIISLVLIFIPINWKNIYEIISNNSPIIVKAIIFIVILQLIIQMQTENIQPFIYFQF